MAETAADPSNASVRRPNFVRRIYAWVLHWAETPYAVPALFCIAFAESSFFPIPPDVLLIALCLGRPKSGFRFAAWCAVGSVTGGMFGYLIGYAAEPLGRWIIFDLLHQGAAWDVVARAYGENAFLAILTAAFTVIPYKVFTIAAGVFHEQVSLLTLVGASAIGRTARFVLVAAVIWKFGPPVKTLLDRYFELFAIVFAVVLIGSFFAIKYLL